MTHAFDILVLNKIAPSGLALLPPPRFRTGGDFAAPHAILCRSADLHARGVPASVLAVARAGAGTNNIPVAELTARGVPVFNAPGANANAVKELVLAGMLMAARRLPQALAFVDALDVVVGVEAEPAVHPLRRTQQSLLLVEPQRALRDTGAVCDLTDLIARDFRLRLILRSGACHAVILRMAEEGRQTTVTYTLKMRWVQNHVRAKQDR